MVTPSATVTVFWRPGCAYCRRLRSKLKRAGVPTHEVNIWEDSDGAAFVRSVAGGNETVPTVRVGTRWFVNPSPRRLIALIKGVEPGTADSGDEEPGS